MPIRPTHLIVLLSLLLASTTHGGEPVAAPHTPPRAARALPDRLMTLDRIEGHRAIIEADTDEWVELPAALLPPHAAEGARLLLIVVSPDQEESRARLRRLQRSEHLSSPFLDPSTAL